MTRRYRQDAVEDSTVLPEGYPLVEIKAWCDRVRAERRAKRIPPQEFMVLMALAQLFAECSHTGLCFPSHKTIAARCWIKACVGTVKNALRRAVAIGLIEIIARHDQGDRTRRGLQTSNVYRLRMPSTPIPSEEEIAEFKTDFWARQNAARLENKVRFLHALHRDEELARDAKLRRGLPLDKLCPGASSSPNLESASFTAFFPYSNDRASFREQAAAGLADRALARQEEIASLLVRPERILNTLSEERRADRSREEQLQTLRRIMEEEERARRPADAARRQRHHDRFLATLRTEVRPGSS